MRVKTLLAVIIGIMLVMSYPGLCLAEDNGFAFNINPGVYFGSISYSDADENGFSGATLSGYDLNILTEFGKAFDLEIDYKNASSLNAVASAAAWDDMPEDYIPEEAGKLDNRILTAIFHYRSFGIGLMKYDFKVEETGFEELRSYQGILIEVGHSWQVNPKRQIYGKVQYANLDVDDWVKGDYDDPERTATANYQGSFVGLEGGVDWLLSSKCTLSAGISYQLLSGDGQANDNYRFLDHEYQFIGFTVDMNWRF